LAWPTSATDCAITGFMAANCSVATDSTVKLSAL
jgi:hypothetical protein